MNKVCLTGRITKDVELRYTETGTAVARFNIAVARNYKNTSGEYDTDFITCVVYRKTAEILKEYISKGDLLGITGRIQTRNYKDNDNKTVYVTEIIADNVDFLHTKGNSSNKEKSTSNEAENPVKNGLSDDVFADFGSSIEITDDDIAF